MDIKKIIREELDDIDWMRDTLSPLNLDEFILHDGRYYLFYFYPSISSDEYDTYVKPVLGITLPNHKFGYTADNIDHMEIHFDDKPGSRGDKILAGYSGNHETTEDSFIDRLVQGVHPPNIYSGRDIFGIP